MKKDNNNTKRNRMWTKEGGNATNHTQSSNS